jgi:two-component system phosphate regulon sensor histidine kinase PhoR
MTGKKASIARRQADFLANVSHEFRTPLSAIRLYAQTIQSGKLANDPVQAAQCLTTILRETEWLDMMIDRVLTWRASAKDMMPLVMEVLPVSGAIEHAIERFRTMVAPDDLDFSSAINSRLQVRHDGRALNAVVLNLLINAYKYTGASKRIHLTVRDDATHVVIEVRDNGVGLTPAEAKRVFQPFYRAEQPDGSDAGGVGLGLAIAQHLVHRHAGTIAVASEKGKGSSFTIRLPAVSEVA